MTIRRIRTVGPAMMAGVLFNCCSLPPDIETNTGVPNV
jgi:hypothetical protein